MKNAKRNAIITLLIIALCVAGLIYMVINGVGAEKTGRAEDIPLGLDLQGGVSVTYQIEDKDPDTSAINATKEKLQKRVDGYSTDGSVYLEGDDRISVEIPLDTSKYDANQILDDLGRPGTLEFIDPENYALADADGDGVIDATAVEGETYKAALTGADVKNAQAGARKDNLSGAQEYVVQLQFTDEGAVKFAEVTGANVGNVVYIVYDKKVVSYPRVNEAINGGSAEINNMSSYEEANELATTIKIGALPLTLTELRSQIVGATLGSEALSTSLKAGIVGLILIFVIMIVVFRFPGLVAAMALCIYTLLELFFLNTFHISLTLPGIAGILLSIGMAVDANVIIFTRIKEEIADGKTVKTAIKNGFGKAFSAIFDGNITTIIAGVVLLLMGSGTVKGFARTLILGIILSMFTALVVTRLLLNAFCDLGINNKVFYGKAKEAKVRNYSKYFKITAPASLVVIALGLIFLIVNKNMGSRGSALNFSLEFSGGTSTSVTFDKAYTQAEAEKDIIPVIQEAAGIKSNIQVQIVDNTNQVIFKSEELNESQRKAVNSALSEKFGVKDADVESENISSTISNEMQRDAILAVVIASILILIYIAFRFDDVRFGASAVIALVHDVLVTFMVYSVAYLSVGGTFIACMLTIVGYSINATIIIFDRIRENLKEMSVEKDGVDGIVNKSISQTLSRNVYSTLTTFVTVLMLNIMGVASLKEFTFTLMAGLICGMYSSIFITGPLWMVLRKYVGKKEDKAKAAKAKKTA